MAPTPGRPALRICLPIRWLSAAGEATLAPSITGAGFDCANTAAETSP